MAVLVTGAAGHIGSNVARTLLDNGYEVVGYDAVSPPPFTVLAPKMKSLPFVTGSVLDSANLLNTVKKYRVDSIVHLAGMLGGAQDKPIEAVRVNVEGSQNMLEAGRIMDLGRVIVTSSHTASGSNTGKDPHSQRIMETEFSLPVNAHDILAPYASTKLMVEELTYLYKARYGVSAVAIRPARVYGPGIAPGRYDGFPIEALFHRALRGEAVNVAQGRDSWIDLTYAKDEAMGYLLALQAENPPSHVYNIGGGQVYSVAQMVDAVKATVPGAQVHVGPGEWVGISASARHLGPMRPAPDITRAEKELEYRPRFAELPRALADYKKWLEEGRY